MSPLMALIVLVVALSAILSVTALVLRKWRLAAVGAPCVLLFALWVVLASRAPDSALEIVRIFGSEVAARASNIQMKKPLLMDGYFISFTLPRGDFDRTVRSQFLFSATGSVLQSRALPAGWPKSIENAPAIEKDLNGESVLLTYDDASQRVFASVWYEEW
ncbi:MAG: hypothetical protein R3F03_02785 [Opitutaceae bacterium]